MTDHKELCERLSRQKWTREEWHEPYGQIDLPCDEDDFGSQAHPANPDGPAAADAIEALVREREWRPICDYPLQPCGALLYFPSAECPDAIAGQDYRTECGWWNGKRWLEQGTSHDMLEREPEDRPSHWIPIPASPARHRQGEG